jgi:hypothetical protein
VDYREVNKAMQKDHFPLPFIDQVLDTLIGKKLSSFLDGFSGYNQIQIAPEDQDKATFTCSFISKMPSAGLIMGTFEKIMNLIFSNTVLDLLIENTSFNPGITGTLLNNPSLSSW